MKNFLYFGILVVAFMTFTLSLKSAEGESMVGADLGIYIPTGDLGDGANTSFGFNATFEYLVSNNLGLTGTIGYISWSTKSSALSLSTIPITAGVRYYFDSNSDMIFFIGGDLGIYTNKAELNIFGFKNDDSSTDFGISLLGGVLYPINENISLRGILNFVNIFTEGENMNYLALRFGAVYHLR